MNYLRKKLQGIMTCSDFEGYLRTISGAPPLTLPYSLGKDITSLTLTGNAVQNGTPSPDNPVEIYGVGERTINLLDVSQFASSSAGYVENGEVYVTGYPYQPGITPEEFLAMTGLKEGDTVTTYADLTKNTSGVQAIRFDKRSTAPAELNNVILYYYRASQTVTIPKGFNSTNYNQMYIYAGMAEIEPGLRGVYRNVMMVKGSPEEQPSYEPYGYKIPVQISGINLFDAHGIVNNTNNAGVILTEYEGKNCFSFIASASAQKEQWMKGQFKENTQYTFYLNTKSNLGYNIHIIYTDGTSSVMTVGGAIAGDWKVITRTSQAGKTIDYWRGHFNNNNRVYIDLSSSHILEGAYTAETMPTYEPYHEPQTVNIYTDKPLYSVGGISDTVKLDIANNQAVLTNNTSEVTSYNGETINGDYISSTGGLTTGAQVVYKLDTPITTDITDMQEWSNMPKTWRGTVIVSENTAVQPSSMTVQYYATKPEEG